MTLAPYYWLIAFVVLLIVEGATMGLTTIWFAGGTIAAFVVNLLGGNIWIQIGVFLAVSFLLLIFTRPVAVKYLNQNRTKTNIDEVIGQNAVVTEKIDNLQGCGQIRLKGMDWTARTAEGAGTIEKGTTVEVVAIEGVKLIVKEHQ